MVDEEEQAAALGGWLVSKDEVLLLANVYYYGLHDSHSVLYLCRSSSWSMDEHLYYLV